MRRVRWFSAEWPMSMRTLASKMKASLFTKDSDDGFVLDTVRENSISARYAEKLIYQETIVDPFGNEEAFERVSYRQVAFSLFSDFPNIELRDAPRNTNAFISKLLELNNFDLAVSHLSISLLDWVVSIEKDLNRKIQIDALQIVGLELETGVTAKILVKGDKDVRNSLDQLTRKRNYTLEKVQIKAPFDRKDINILLTNNGGVKFPEDYENELLPILRKSLPANKSNH